MVLDPNAQSGRPVALTENEKDHLVAFVKRNFTTRQMKLVDIRQEAGLFHVCNGTVFNALVEHGLGAYWGEFKFILSPECKTKRLVCPQSSLSLKKEITLFRSEARFLDCESGRRAHPPAAFFLREWLSWEFY